jgi:hypothetical protein
MVRATEGFTVGRFTATCASSGRVLAAGEPIVATLCDAPSDEASVQGFVRRDFALEAWSAGARPGGMVCFWKTVAPAPDEKRRILVDDDTLLELFDAERWLVQRRGVDETTPPIVVLNPHLRDEDLQELAEHLGEVMQSEL